MPFDVIDDTDAATVAFESPAQAGTPTLHVPGVAWRYVPSAEWLSEADAGSCLSEGESFTLAGLRHPARRRQWLAGRIAAKELVRDAECLGDVSLSSIEIVTRDAAGKGSPPIVRMDSERLPVRLSLAHTNRGLIVACSESAIGVDLVDLADVRPAALRTWFTADELASLESRAAKKVALSLRDRKAGRAKDAQEPNDAIRTDGKPVAERQGYFGTAALNVALHWGVKEAVYKAVCVDEPFAPKQVEAVFTEEGWRCRFYGRALNSLRIDIRPIDGHVAVLITNDTK